MRRTNGEGTVFRDTQAGGWIGMTTIAGRRRKVHARTKTDALAKLAKMKHADAQGLPVTNGKATLKPVLEHWGTKVLANRDLASSSRENYALAVRVLIDEFGKVRLQALDVPRVERGLEAIATGKYGRGKPLGRRSMKLFRETLVQALDSAVRREQLHRNPASYAELPAVTTKQHRRQAVTAADALKLWAVCDDGRLGAAFKLMMTTTLRPGEALGVCWDALNRETGELDLRRAVQVQRGRAVLVDNLKTENAERSLIVPAPTLEALRARHTRVAGMKLASSSWPDPDPQLCFPTTFGGPWNPKNARVELAVLCARAGIRRVSPGELRHTAKAILDDARIDPVVIRNLMGHSTEWMQDQYGNRSRPAEDGHVAVMERLFGG